MSASANVELVRSIVADWEGGDFGSLGWADAEIELVVADGPEPVSLRGLRAALEYWRGRVSSWRDYRLVGEDYRALDAEHVLVLVHVSGRREGSRDVEGAHRGGDGLVVFVVRAGRVTRLVAYLDRDRALAELGLAPGASSP